MVKAPDGMEGLLAALAESPDDVASWSVYGDFLQARSDPRGELISLMVQREQHPSPRLFDAQRRLLAKHAAALVPEGISTAGVVWRHGFVAELRIDAPDQLAILAEPALRFVDSVTLAIDGEQWLDWREGLAGHHFAWREVTVELVNPPDQLELAVLFASCPAVTRARFQLPDDDAATLAWDGVVAHALRRLVLVNAGHVAAFPGVELPALRELWLLGESEATESVREQWRGIDRLVVASEGDDESDDAANVVAYRTRAENYGDDYNYDYAVPSSAFMIVGGRLELALLEKLVARMTGLAQLSVRIAELWWQRKPVTVVQLYGTREPDSMLPYSLAVTLENVLAPAPPIVLVEIAETTAQFLAFGETQARGSVTGDDEPVDVVRRAFDLALGSDPGSAIVEDIRDALAAAPEHTIVGSVRGDRILNVIDPRATPLDAVDEEPDYDEEEEDEDEWGYEDVPWQDDLERYEEPVPVARLVVKSDEDLWVEQQQAQEDEELGVPEPDEEIELSAIEVVEQPEAWFEFREHWDDRAGDPNDEPGEIRWPDPEVISNEQVLDVDRQIAEPACHEHESPFETCSWCSARICIACLDTAPIEAPIAGVCASCLTSLDRSLDPPLPPFGTSTPRARIVS
jgi:uncharacterized protein (TIGR02996 family)